jgi:hypothetical protein
VVILGQDALGLLQLVGAATLVQGGLLGPLQLVQEPFQAPLHLGGLGLQAFQPGSAHGFFVVQSVKTPFQLGDLALKGQPLLLAGQGLLLGLGLLLLQGLERGFLVAEGALGQGEGFLGLGQLGLPEAQGPGGLHQQGLQLRKGIPGFGQAIGQGLDVLGEAAALPFGLLAALLLEAALLVRQLQPLVQPEDGVGSLGLGLLLLVHGEAEGLHFGGLLGDLGRQLRHPPFRLVQQVEGPLLGGLQFHGLAREQDALGGFDLRIQLLCLPGPGGLAAQRIHLLVQLEEDVIQALQVGARLVQAFLRIGAAELVARDARGLLEQHAPVLGLAAEDQVDLALLDEAVGAGAHAGVQQEILHVLEAAFPAVDAVFAPRVPVEAPGDDHLARGPGQRGVGHLEDQLHLGHAHGTALGRAREDHVRHLGTTQHGGPLLPEHPGEAVGDVGLPAPVRAHHGGHPTREAELLGLGEGLESVEFEGDQAHLRSFREKAWGTSASIIPHHAWDPTWASVLVRPLG